MLGESLYKMIPINISQYTRDSKRIDTAVRLGLVNPYSYHPTKAGHHLIAELINQQIAL